MVENTKLGKNVAHAFVLEVVMNELVEAKYLERVDIWDACLDIVGMACFFSGETPVRFVLVWIHELGIDYFLCQEVS